MNILPLTYLGNIEYFTKLCREDCIIDVHENYIKQTFRNRADIMSANGAISLSVNLKKPSSPKAIVKDMRIDYSKRWQHQHWRSIVSAYRNSVYFDHFEHHFAPFYHQKYDFLFDFNVELTTLVKKLLGYGEHINISQNYVIAKDDDKDLRAVFSPKYKPTKPFLCPEYYQVFSEKINFVPNLSIIDLLFCENTLL